MTSTSPREWRIDLSHPSPPLSLNDRRHWAAVHRIKKQLLNEVRIRARAARIPRLERIHVELHYLPARRRVRDADNLTLTLKPCIDGLRDYPAQVHKGVEKQPPWRGIVADDRPEIVQWEPPVIHQPDAKHRGPRLWLVIRELA